VADGFYVHIRRKRVGKQFATWNAMSFDRYEKAGSNTASNR
jgi:hypothetical protein